MSVVDEIPDKSGRTEGSAQSLSRQGMSGLLWSLSSVGGQAVLQIAVLIVLARKLSPADFGVVGMAVLVTAFSQALSEIGVGPALVQRSDLTVAHLRTAQFLSLLFASLFAVTIWTQAHEIADFLNTAALADVLPAYALLFMLRGVSIVSEAQLQRELKLRLLALVDFSGFLLGYAVTAIVLAMLGFGVWALVFAHIGQALVKSAGLIWVGHGLPLPLLKPGAAKDLLRYGAGQSFGRLAGFTALQGDRAVIGKLLDAHALGVYGRAYQLVVMPVMVLGRAVDWVLFPAMSKLVLERERLKTSYRRGLSIAALLTMPTLVALVVLAPEIISVILGSQWDAVVVPFQIMACGLPMHLGYKVTDSLVKATGAVYRRAWWQTVYAVLVVGLAIIAVQWGVIGVTCSTLFAVFVNYIFMVGLGCKLTGLAWSEVLRAQVNGFWLALATGAGTFGAATVLRSIDAPSLVTLSVVLVMSFCLAFSLVALRKEIFLGVDGHWFVARLSESLPGKAGRVTAKLFRTRESG